MSLSDLESLIKMAETDSALQAEFIAIYNLSKNNFSDDVMKEMNDKLISLAQSRNLTITSEDIDAFAAKADETKFSEMLSASVELSDDDLESVAGGKGGAGQAVTGAVATVTTVTVMQTSRELCD